MLSGEGINDYLEVIVINDRGDGSRVEAPEYKYSSLIESPVMDTENNEIESLSSMPQVPSVMFFYPIHEFRRCLRCGIGAKIKLLLRCRVKYPDTLFGAIY